MKKIISLLLSAVLIFGILPVAAMAAETAPVEITAETYADSASVALGGGKDYKLIAGERAVIEENQTWTVAEGSTLYVYGYLDVKGTLTVNGYVTAIGSGEVTAKCWSDDSGASYKYGRIINCRNVCGNETESVKRYFAEIHIPAITKYAGFNDAGHKLTVKYLASRTGSEFDYLASDLYYETMDEIGGERLTAPKWYFADVYSSGDYNASTGMLRVPRCHTQARLPHPSRAHNAQSHGPQAARQRPVIPGRRPAAGSHRGRFPDRRPPERSRCGRV